MTTYCSLGDVEAAFPQSPVDAMCAAGVGAFRGFSAKVLSTNEVTVAVMDDAQDPLDFFNLGFAKLDLSFA